MTQADYAMFPPIFDRQELSPKLKLWAQRYRAVADALAVGTVATGAA